MAAKFVAALACIALCHSSPVIIKGFLVRDGRAYSIGQGYTSNYGGKATGSASINGGVVNAYGSASSDDNQLGRNGIGEAYPGQVVAKAEAYDTPYVPVYDSAYAVPEAQNTPTYYTVPAPATIVSYEQNFAMPAEQVYEIPVAAINAESSAVLNGNSESITSARTDGAGIAESSAQTQGLGSYGVTSSNAKTYGNGYGAATSNANNGYGSAATAAKTEGFGSAFSKSQNGLGLTSAESQSNGGFGSASSTTNNGFDSAIVTANTQGIGSASSNVDINNLPGDVVSSAKTTNQKGIHWRFGTLYGTPSNIGQAHASSQANGGSAKSTAQTNGAGYGNAQSTADAQGYGFANANANLNGAGYANSVANTNSQGFAKSTTQTNGYGSANSIASNNGYGTAKSSVNNHGFGNANAQADLNGPGSAQSSANSNGFGNGQAASIVNAGLGYGALRADGFIQQPIYGGSRLTANAQTTGQGSASSLAKSQGMHTGYRVINSAANTYGYGSAQANAQSI